MNAISAVTQALLADSGVSAIVGDRINPIIGPQGGSYPDIVVHQISNPDEILLSGTGSYPNARVQIECRASTATAAMALGDAVIAAFDGLRGTFAGMNVTSFLPTGTDTTDSATDWSTFRRLIHFSVRYRQGS